MKEKEDKDLGVEEREVIEGREVRGRGGRIICVKFNYEEIGENVEKKNESSVVEESGAYDEVGDFH